MDLDELMDYINNSNSGNTKVNICLIELNYLLFYINIFLKIPLR